MTKLSNTDALLKLQANKYPTVHLFTTANLTQQWKATRQKPTIILTQDKCVHAAETKHIQEVPGS